MVTEKEVTLHEHTDDADFVLFEIHLVHKGFDKLTRPQATFLMGHKNLGYTTGFNGRDQFARHLLKKWIVSARL